MKRVKSLRYALALVLALFVVGPWATLAQERTRSDGDLAEKRAKIMKQWRDRIAANEAWLSTLSLEELKTAALKLRPSAILTPNNGIVPLNEQGQFYPELSEGLTIRGDGSAKLSSMVPNAANPPGQAAKGTEWFLDTSRTAVAGQQVLLADRVKDGAGIAVLDGNGNLTTKFKVSATRWALVACELVMLSPSGGSPGYTQANFSFTDGTATNYFAVFVGGAGRIYGAIPMELEADVEYEFGVFSLVSGNIIHAHNSGFGYVGSWKVVLL